MIHISTNVAISAIVNNPKLDRLSVVITRLHGSRTMDTLGEVMLTVGLINRYRVCSRDM